MRKAKRRVRVDARSMGSAVHPGEWLQRAFLDEYGVSQTALARAMGVSPRRINEIILGRRAITGETALLLEQATGYSAQQWMAFQAGYDLERARMLLAGRPPRKIVPLSPLEEPIDGRASPSSHDA